MMFTMIMSMPTLIMGLAGGAAFGLEFSGGRSLAVFEGSEDLIYYVSLDLDSCAPADNSLAPHRRR